MEQADLVINLIKSR